MKINDRFGHTDQVASGSKKRGQNPSDFDDTFSQISASLGAGSTVKVPDSFHQGEQSDGLAATDANETANQKLLDDFAKWSKMSPTERIRAQYLEAHGLTEASLNQLPENVRKAIEDDIKQQIKEQLQKKTEEANGGSIPGPSLSSSSV